MNDLLWVLAGAASMLPLLILTVIRQRTYRAKYERWHKVSRRQRNHIRRYRDQVAQLANDLVEANRTTWPTRTHRTTNVLRAALTDQDVAAIEAYANDTSERGES